MKTPATKSKMLLSISIGLILGFSAACQAQTVTRVSAPGVFANAVDIADNGLVLGIVPDESGNLSNPTAFVWDNAGTSKELLKGDFIQTGVSAINDSGTVVGTCNTLNTTVAVVWRDGVPVILPDLGVGGRANDINNQGEIAGVVYRPENFAYMPAKWNAQGELIQLDAAIIEGEMYQPFGTGEVISENGQVGGVFSNPRFPSAFAFWNENVLTCRPAGSFVVLNVGGINNQGVLAGSGFAGGDGRQSFVISAESEFVPLNSSTGYASSEVSGINNANDVVGYSIDTLGESGFSTVGTFWQGGRAFRVTLPPGVSSSLADVNENRIAVGTITDGEDTYIAKFDLSAFSPEIDIAPLPVLTPGAQVTVTARARRTSGATGRAMQFQWNQIPLGSAKINSRGIARMSFRVPLNSAQRVHDIAASLGSSRYLVIGAPVLKGTVMVQARRPTLTRKGSLIQAVLRNSGTNEPLPLRDVTFFIGDKTFSATTDSSGVASKVVSRAMAPRGVNAYSVDVPETPSHKGASSTYRR